jgi:hypothetical protein
VLGDLIEVEAPGQHSSAKDFEDLKSKIQPPQNASKLNRIQVRKFLAAQVGEVGKLESDRRNGVLKIARLMGGYLWTDAFTPEEVVFDDDEPDAGENSLSLSAAYILNGGSDDNGDNNLSKGILDAMASGALRPLIGLPHQGSDAGAFGVALERSPMPLDMTNPDFMADQVERVLIANEVQIFRRTGSLVRISEEELPPYMRNAQKIARFVDVDPIWLRAELGRFIRFTRRERNGTVVDTAPPLDLARHVMARDERSLFPSVAAIIGTPTLRSDGTILSKPGYDPDTHLYLLEFPTLDIPESPTRAFP